MKFTLSPRLKIMAGAYLPIDRIFHQQRTSFMSSSNSERSLACDLSALTPQQREHHSIQSPLLFATVQEVSALPDGYRFRLTESPEVLAQVADFIAHERLCCPFFNFGLTVEPYDDVIWLSLSGEEGVKELIQAEIAGYLPESVATAAGLRA
jgi:hypothetical protein